VFLFIAGDSPMFGQNVRQIQFRLLSFFAVTMLGLEVASSQVVGHHECKGHSSDWHKHAGDGYWTSQWKITKWQPHYLIKDTQTGNVTKWTRLIDRVFTNEDCDPSPTEVMTKESVTHVVHVGGSFTGGQVFRPMASILFLQLQSETRANVTLNAECSDTRTQEITISTFEECWTMSTS